MAIHLYATMAFETWHAICIVYTEFCDDGHKSKFREEVFNLGKNQHVVPANGQWGVKGEGNSRMTSLHSTQREAIAAARAISRNQGSELFIHGRNGQIRGRDSHGHDPYPPEG